MSPAAHDTGKLEGSTPEAGRPALVVLAHTVPGRTRLRVADHAHDTAFFTGISDRLAAHPNVDSVTANPQTRSILLRHQGTIEAIIADVSDVLRLVPRAATPAAKRSGPSLPAMRSVSGVQWLALGCVLVGAYQVRRGRIFGTASENFWNAYNAWRNVQRPGLAAVLLGGGLAQLARGHVLSSAASLIYYAASLRHQSSRSGKARIPP